QEADSGGRGRAAPPVDAAKTAYARASELAPGNEELLFWKAAGLYKAGEERAALPLFEKVFRAWPDWARVVPRLTGLDILADGPEAFEKAVGKILAVAPPSARKAALAE